MTTMVLPGYDATSENESVLPVDQMAAGYDTQAGGGTGFIAWTPEQWDAHLKPFPAVHIDQDANASDALADILDVEAGAAKESEIVGWLARARNSFHKVLRPGQRWPGIYCSASNVTSAVLILHDGGVTNVPFWVADYSVSYAEASRRVITALGPYPAIAYQYNDLAFGGKADSDIFSVNWLTKVSVSPVNQEDDPMIFNKETFVPLPPGKYSKLYLWRDFSPTTIRVAIRVGGKWEISNYDTTPTAVTLVALPAGSVAVSLVLETGDAPVGYALA